MDFPSHHLQVLVAGAVLFFAGFTVRSFLGQPDRRGILLSPRVRLLPKLTQTEVSELPYPPDAYPGGRAVRSPFGTLQVYEFGPEDGRKVLCVHGISTPCVAIGGLAHALVDKGCRVMMFDLPGRGYSDAPVDLDHDIRLYMSAILVVLSSSKLAWTGQNGFSLVGYSLGGGISASFTSYFPEMIRDLVLIAPAGLIRDSHIGTVSKLLYSRTILFEPIVLRVLGKRLRKPVTLGATELNQPDDEESTDPKKALQAEVAVDAPTRPILSRSYPHLRLEGAVNHQIDFHQGYVRSVLSSLRYAPIWRHHEDWKKLGEYLKAQDQEVLMILGEHDPVIKFDETREDAMDVLEGRVRIEVLETGHETCVSKADECAEHIWRHWNKE
ncbi:hypothetical protein LTR51_001702 [Lithohypha guttulata]|nr:hypothetical protein LTR51_001702 [Lithohypha guttulata]